MSKHRKVRLTNEQREKLQQIAVSGDEKYCRATKAHILLLTDRNQEQRMLDSEIIEKLGTSICTIVRTRRRFCEIGLDAVVGKKPPKRRPPKYDRDVLHRVILTILKKEPTMNNNRWTIKLLTDHLNNMDNPIPISQTMVYRTLQKMNIRLSSLNPVNR